jgi:hypothetical protein
VHGSMNARLSRHAGSVFSIAAGVAVGIASAGVALAAGFPPSETVFPDTTRAWLSVPDPRGLQERFDRSPYGQLLADPNMKKFVESFRQELSKNGRQRLKKLGLTLEDLEKLPGGELAVAAVEAEPGRLATVLMVDVTGNEAEAKALVDRIGTRLVEQKAAKVTVPGAPPQLTVYQLPPDPLDTRADAATRQRRVAFALAPAALIVGDDALQVGQAFAVLAQGRKDSLASNASFQVVAERCRGAAPAAAAPVRWFVDPLAFARAYQTSNPPREKRKGPDYVAILGRQGFDAVKGVGGLVVFGDGPHSLRHHTMIHAPALPGRDPDSPERFDLAARMLRFVNATAIVPPAWVPRDVASWTALQWDMKTAFASAESLVDDIVGDKGVFDDVVASLKEDPDGPQIDVEQDLVVALGSRVSLVTDSVEPVGTDSDRLVIAIEATDEARVAATVAKVMNADSDMQRIEIGGRTAWELIDHSHALPSLDLDVPGGAVAHSEEQPGDEAHRRRQRLRQQKDEKFLPHSAVTVAHGHLLIASHRDVLERVLVAADGGESLAGAADFVAVRTELDRLLPSACSSRSFAREAESIRSTYELLRQGSMPKSKSVFGQLLNGLLGDGKPGSVREQRVDGSSLPEFELVRRYFGTTGMGMETRADGWYVVGAVLPPAQQDKEVARSPATPVGR